MKVITYNLHKGRDRRRRESILHDAVHALADRGPDILLCQEVFHGIEDDVAQCHFITEVVGHPHVFGPNSHYERGCHGNATFARLPIANHKNHDITESYFEKRGILHTELAGNGRTIDVLNLHFSLTGAQRRRQWRKLLDALPEDEGTPVLAAGDFNDWAGGLDRKARASGRLANALWHLPRRERASFPARRPFFALDRIYYRGFEVAEVRVLRGEPWSRLSDHLPVEVRFV